MSAREFDLSIERVLENKTLAHAIRELIANTLDEAALTGTAEPEITQDADGSWHVRYFGRGPPYEHLTQNENRENLANPEKVVGKFGVRLKDALATSTGAASASGSARASATSRPRSRRSTASATSRRSMPSSPSRPTRRSSAPTSSSAASPTVEMSRIVSTGRSGHTARGHRGRSTAASRRAQTVLGPAGS